MSFPRYPEYKDSGIPWLGEVPAHWFLGRVKHVCSFFTGWTPPTGDAAAYIGENLWANISDLGPKWLNETAKTISDDAVRKSDIQVSRVGDLLFSFKLSIGQVSFAGRDLYTNEAIATFPPSSRLHLPFAYYALPFFMVRNASENIYGARLLNQELMRAACVALPGKDEQERIAVFLDRETAKIDALVAEQEKLIALLKEKRQAVISQAVTKGLDPTVPMKDSGVEWLGEVPAHWTTPAMYMRYSSELGKMLDSAKITGRHLIPYMRNVDVQWGEINFDDLPEMDIHEDEYERYIVRTGDLLVCEGGEVGRAAIVPPVSGNFGYQKALHRLRALDASEDSRFMYFTLLWAANTGVFNQSGSSTIAHLTGEQLRKYRFPKPPVAEQKAIAAFLEAESAKFDSLTTGAQSAITLLQERRSALISAAVTGQIDVRNIRG